MISRTVFVLAGASVLATNLFGCGSGSSPSPSPEKARAKPACRKQTELITLNVPASAGSSDNVSVLTFFGGEGYDYMRNATDGKLEGGVQFLHDTWMFDIGNDHWHKPDLSHSLKPHRRWKAASTTIDGGRSYVVHGGCKTESPKDVLNDLWVFTPTTRKTGNWRQVKAKHKPRARRGHIMTTNSTHLIVFGGKGFNKTEHHHFCLNDLWALPLSALEDGAKEEMWTQGTTFPGEGRWGATGSVISAPGGKELLAVFGGRMKLNDTYVYYPELWTYDTAVGNWTLQPNGDTFPPARDHHADAVLGGELFIFGGRVKDETTADAALSDVWSYSPSTGRWTERFANGTVVDGGEVPQQRFGIGVDTVMRKGKEVLAVFGGETLPGGKKTSTTNDLWIYDPNRLQDGWEKISQGDCSAEALYPHDAATLEEVKDEDMTELTV